MLQLSKMQMKLTLESAIKEGTQLSLIRKANEDNIIYAIAALISHFCTAMNISPANTMDTVQVYEAACLMVDKYWMMKLEEFVLVFKRAKTGEYGKIYNRLDVQVMCEWLDNYLKSEERAAYFERTNSAYKTLEKEPMTLDMAKHLTPMFQHVEPKKQAEKLEIKQPTYEEWLDSLKSQMETMTISELKSWQKQGLTEGLDDVVSCTTIILEEYRTGQRTYPHNQAS